MNLRNHVRAREHQQFVASLFAPVIVGSKVAELDVRAHRAVIDDDALIHGFQKFTHQEREPFDSGKYFRIAENGKN